MSYNLIIKQCFNHRKLFIFFLSLYLSVHYLFKNVHYLLFIIILLLFSHQSDSGKANLSSSNSTTYDSSSQGINNEIEDTIDKVDQFMYIQMEFCEKSTLRY